ncbi:alcohol dehydrogenase catalytic domain-containing protein [Derxia gummosa]|uniref:Alcohol dehydrogenase catalytic domain-containing protein n=1 Tax=Derxia gummosa DSM 723 TaxID=1121388 RepID=A0A9U5G6M1_9BURK|nr:alcohol dehydrogenase catalytic domain-containing protein [Derxia gummosa]
MVATGSYFARSPEPVIPCSDGAGEVVEVGAGVTGWKPGDRVCANFFPHWIWPPAEYTVGSMRASRRVRRGWAYQSLWPVSYSLTASRAMPPPPRFQYDSTRPVASVPAYLPAKAASRPSKASGSHTEYTPNQSGRESSRPRSWVSSCSRVGWRPAPRAAASWAAMPRATPRVARRSSPTLAARRSASSVARSSAASSAMRPPARAMNRQVTIRLVTAQATAASTSLRLSERPRRRRVTGAARCAEEEEEKPGSPFAPAGEGWFMVLGRGVEGTAPPVCAGVCRSAKNADWNARAKPANAAVLQRKSGSRIVARPHGMNPALQRPPRRATSFTRQSRQKPAALSRPRAANLPPRGASP